MGTKVDRLSDAESGATTGSAKSTSTGSTTGTGGRGTGRGRRTGGKTEEKAGTPRVVNVEVPGKEKEISDEEKKAEEKRKKDRERKARSRANAKSSPRPKSKTSSMEILQLKPILMTMSQMVATREGFEIWALSESEIETLCEPIQNMLAKTSALEKVGENSDAIALVIACFTIFVPKFLMWNAIRKQKKATVITNYAKPIQSTGNAGGDKTGTTGTSPRHGSGKTSVSSETFSGDISSLIPPSAPF